MIKLRKTAQMALVTGATLWIIAAGLRVIHHPAPSSIDDEIQTTSAELYKVRDANLQRADAAKSKIGTIKGALWSEEKLTSWRKNLDPEWIAEPYGPGERRSVLLNTFTFELNQAPYETGWPSIVKMVRELANQSDATIRTVTIQGSPAPGQLFQRVFISATFASKLP